MERAERKGHRAGQNVLPFGNAPEDLAKSPEGRSILRKQTAQNMLRVYGQIGRLEPQEAERLANQLRERDLPRREILQRFVDSQQLVDKLVEKSILTP